MTTDLIQVVDCLTEAEVSRCLTLLENVFWEPTTIGNGEGKWGVDRKIRDNLGCGLDEEDEVTIIIHEAMNKALLTYKDEVSNNISKEFGKYPVPGGYDTDSFREVIQVLSYTNNEFYNWHHDQDSDYSIVEGQRIISVILYLQNAEEGGRTIFPHKAYKPKPGQALIFPSNWCYPHRGEEVRKGRKLVAVTWYRSEFNSKR